MYARMSRRRLDQSREAETAERAAREFWPKLQQAPGFVSLTLIHGDDGIASAVTIFEGKAEADAFHEDAVRWQRTLDELGHQLESQSEGEVGRHITPNG